MNTWQTYHAENAYLGGTVDIAWLEVFREVAARGSLTAAAQALGYTQPAVSRQVAALVQPGDVVTHVGAVVVNDQVDLERAFLGYSPKAPIDVVVQRSQESVKLTVELSQFDESKATGFSKRMSVGPMAGSLRAVRGARRAGFKDRPAPRTARKPSRANELGR